MIKENFTAENIKCSVYKPEGEIKAVLLFIHGMTEHFGRYEKFAEYLSENKIALVGYDLKGHGENKLGNTASFGEGGWSKSLKDIDVVYAYLKNEYNNIPLFISGFSLGSFLVREYLSLYKNDFSGAIIMGTGHQPSFILSVIKSIIKGEIKKSGFNSSTDLVNKLSFETYNGKFKNIKTSFDWLIQDEAEREKYISDNLCAENISAGLFYDLLDAMQRAGKNKIFEKYNKNIPYLLISGSSDPVGDFTKGVKNLDKVMKSKGLKVELQFIDEARHDLLHEEVSFAADKARNIICDFLLKNV